MKTVAKALRDAGFEAKILKEEFHEGALDQEWLPKATAQGWILLTKDDRWRYRQAEKQIFINAKARAFVFVSKTAKKQEIAETVVNCVHKMAKIIATVPSPFIAHILLSGHVYVVYPDQTSSAISSGAPPPATEPEL